VPGGNGSLVAANTGNSATGPGSGPTASTFEIDILFSNLGLSAGDSVDFVVVYANNNDQDNAFMSDEGFPGPIAGGNPGNGPVTLTDYHRLGHRPRTRQPCAAGPRRPADARPQTTPSLSRAGSARPAGRDVSAPP